ncbi:transporter [Datura stramonium]|uniref:Transporter n=1 Tax=Datura stramonium TaxID=4076 RepID=A0ABS8RPD7_DATST|nr:transporter [Datura stramonium]
MLQGWDNATIAGSVLYIKKEFNLQTQPTIEGLIVAMSLIGATVITTLSDLYSYVWSASNAYYFICPLFSKRISNVVGSKCLYVASSKAVGWICIGLAVTLVPAI